MKFKIPKEQLINNMAIFARSSSYQEIKNTFNTPDVYNFNGDSINLSNMLAYAVSFGIEEGIRAAMSEFFAQEFTDDDFERDLNLK